MRRAAMLGGEIRHDEIRSSQTVTSGGGTVSSIAAYVVDHGWIGPTCEILHYAGLCLLLGTVLLVNLRMLGFVKSIQFADLRGLLPWGLFGFGINVVTGVVFLHRDSHTVHAEHCFRLEDHFLITRWNQRSLFYT